MQDSPNTYVAILSVLVVAALFEEGGEKIKQHYDVLINNLNLPKDSRINEYVNLILYITV